MYTNLKFKKKETHEVNVLVRDIVKNDGCVKLDPVNNPRLPMGSISLSGSTDAVIKKAQDATIQNNLDYEWLRKDMSELGFNTQKTRITAMDLVEYLYAKDNRTNITKAYKDDIVFVETCNKILEILEDTDITEEEAQAQLDDYRNRYYIVVGGNTRVSIMKEWFEKSPKSFKGCMRIKLPINVIDYKYFKILDRKYQLHTGDQRSAKNMYDTSRLYQVAYALTAYTDNAQEGKKNSTTEAVIGSRAYIANTMIQYCDIHGQDKDSFALDKISSFKRAYKYCGSNLEDTTLARAIVSEEITNHVARTGRKVTKESLTTSIRIITRVLCKQDKTSGSVKACEMLGFDSTNYHIANTSRLDYFLDQLEKLYDSQGRYGWVASESLAEFAKDSFVNNDRNVTDALVQECLTHINEAVFEARKQDDATSTKVLVRLVKDGVITQAQVDTLREEVLKK